MMESQPYARIDYDTRIERLRCAEYPSLLGTTLYASSLIDAYHHDLKSNLYGNPHSESPASNLATHRADDARLAVLNYLSADPKHFDVVFTANATASVKLVADCFRDQNFWYGFHKDAHSSIVGIREVAEAGSRCFTSHDQVNQWIATLKISSAADNLKLFAYPAQSNMTGCRLPLSWSARIRDSVSHKYDKQQIYVLLDAASYLTTGRLDLRDHNSAPDFIALSFYKIFGFPDMGALIVRKTAHDVLTCRRYFGGGTVDQVTVLDSPFHAKKTTNIHDYLEDGTLPFHNIIALTHAISTHQRLFGFAQDIADHTNYLSLCIYKHLSSLKHYNRTPVVDIYKDSLSTYGNSHTQGPILAFSVLRSDGTFVGKSHFERLAIDCGFQLRTGGVCNPGGIASMLELSHWELRRNFTEGARCGGDIDVVGGKPTGIIRISLGPMSTLADVRRFAEFVEWFFVEDEFSEQPSPTVSSCFGSTAVCESVSPVQHCSPIDISYIENSNAYCVWNEQWCIVESGSGIWKPLQSGQRLQNLSCRLEPDKGVLRICHDGKPDLWISLWNRPEEYSATIKVSNAYAFAIYRERDVAQWLSNTVGLPCTLARYRGQDAASLPEARTCALSTCKAELSTRDDLQHHYKLHAGAFLLTHAFRSQSYHQIVSSNVQEKQPKRKRPSSWGSTRSWSKKQVSGACTVSEIAPSPPLSHTMVIENAKNIKKRGLKQRISSFSLVAKLFR